MAFDKLTSDCTVESWGDGLLSGPLQVIYRYLTAEPVTDEIIVALRFFDRFHRFLIAPKDSTDDESLAQFFQEAAQYSGLAQAFIQIQQVSSSAVPVKSAYTKANIDISVKVDGYSTEYKDCTDWQTIFTQVLSDQADYFQEIQAHQTKCSLDAAALAGSPGLPPAPTPKFMAHLSALGSLSAHSDDFTLEVASFTVNNNLQNAFQLMYGYLSLPQKEGSGYQARLTFFYTFHLFLTGRDRLFSGARLSQPEYIDSERTEEIDQFEKKARDDFSKKVPWRFCTQEFLNKFLAIIDLIRQHTLIVVKSFYADIHNGPAEGQSFSDAFTALFGAKISSLC